MFQQKVIFLNSLMTDVWCSQVGTLHISCGHLISLPSGERLLHCHRKHSNPLATLDIFSSGGYKGETC